MSTRRRAPIGILAASAGAAGRLESVWEIIRLRGSSENGCCGSTAKQYMNILSYVLAGDPRVAAAARKPEDLHEMPRGWFAPPRVAKDDGWVESWPVSTRMPGLGVPQRVGLFGEAL